MGMEIDLSPDLTLDAGNIPADAQMTRRTDFLDGGIIFANN